MLEILFLFETNSCLRMSASDTVGTNCKKQQQQQLWHKTKGSRNQNIFVDKASSLNLRSRVTGNMPINAKVETPEVIDL